MVQFSGIRDLSVYPHASQTHIHLSRRVRDVSNTIWELDPNAAPLTTLLRNLRKKKVTDVKFEWFEDTYPAQSTTATGDDPSSAYEGIDVTNGAYGRAFDLWMNMDTGEVMMITSVSSNHWNLIRGVGSTSPQDIDTGDVLQYIGNAQQTGAQAREKITTVTSPKYNYCQIFKEAIEITRTAEATRLYGGNDRVYQRSKHGKLHLRDKERGYWFGVKDDLDTSDDAVITTMSYVTGGVFEFLGSGQEEVNLSSAMTEDEFEQILEAAFRYGNMKKFMFCAPRVNTIIDSWGRDKIRLVPSDTTYGIAINRYISAHGELNLITNKLFYDFANITSSDAVAPWNYGTCSVILDLECLGYMYLRDTELQMGIQETDRDSYEDQYLTECGLFLRNPEWHTEIHNWSLS